MAQKAKKIVFIVNGYGCHLDTPLGSVYLPLMVRFIAENWGMLVAVIFSGGFTQCKTRPGFSEARVMADYAWKNMGLSAQPENWHLEEDAYTSLENSQKSASKIIQILGHRGLTYYDIRIVHGCEATRAANVVMLDRHFMRNLVESIDDITVETASWERADPFKQVRNLMYNRAAIKYPWLGLAERERRRRLQRSEQI